MAAGDCTIPTENSCKIPASKILQAKGCMQMQEALTSGACESNISYETLELLGDSILNFAGGTYVFMEHPCFNREQLHLTRHKLVCNKALHQFALLRGLTPYVFAELWNPRLWVPPGPGMGNHGSQEGLVRVSKTYCC